MGNGGYSLNALDPPSAPGDFRALKELTGLDPTLIDQGKSFYLAEVHGLELGSGPWIGVDRGRQAGNEGYNLSAPVPSLDSQGLSSESKVHQI